MSCFGQNNMLDCIINLPTPTECPCFDPKSFHCTNLYGKLDFVDLISFEDLGMGDSTEGTNVITRVFLRENRRVKVKKRTGDDRSRGHSQRQSQRENGSCYISAL